MFMTTQVDTLWLRTVDLSESGKAWLQREKTSSAMAAELAKALEDLEPLEDRTDLEDERASLIAELKAVAAAPDIQGSADDLQLLVTGAEEWGEHPVEDPTGRRKRKLNCFVHVIPFA